MDDLVQFLRTRYDEETAAARAAMNVVGPVLGSGQWRYTESLGDEGGRYWSVTTTAPKDTTPTVELVGSGMSGGGVHEEAVARHIVWHDPARVLAEVEAKRKLIARGGPFCTSDCDEPGNEPMDPDTNWTTPLEHHLDCAAYNAARELAVVYANHPNYDEAWRP
jgi:hypothetical protein